MEFGGIGNSRCTGGVFMTELPIYPSPPDSPPGPALVVLGRFQPFHRGHAHMVESAEIWRSTNAEELPLLIAIGSSNRSESMQNPWTVDERKSMLEAWLQGRDFTAQIVAIPDIEDPPRWVSHAEQYHGVAGTFFTTDPNSAELYKSSGWPVVLSETEQRESFEGWRVRATAEMISTVSDNEAVRNVLSPSVPNSVISYMLENDSIRRLAFLGGGGEPVG